MKVFDDKFVGACRNRFGVGKRGFHRGFGALRGFLTDQFDERIVEKFLSKGDIKYLILNSLKKKPMHGYEIMSSVEKDFQGIYSPSPGAIYPTLQMLEEGDFISCEEDGGKKVYSLTSKGEKELVDNHSRVDEILSRVSEHKQVHWFGREMRNLSKAYTGLGSDVFIGAKKNYRDGAGGVEDKMKEILKILDEARKSVSKVWDSS